MMDDPEVVMAAAALASALFAALAIVLSVIGMVRSTRASRDAQAAREDATSAQWKMSEHLETIAAAQAEAAKAMAAGQPTTGPRGGRLSARLAKRGRGERITVANVGAEPVTILDIVVDQPSILVSDQLEGARDAQLDPGEEFHLAVALTLGTRFPIEVTLRWQDSNGVTERVQRLTLE